MLIHPFVPSVRATSPRDPAKSAQIVPLPNGIKLPTASISAESPEEIFPRWTGFVTKLGPQISLSPVLIFGVNSTITTWCNLTPWDEMIERGVPASPYIVPEAGLQVGLGREY
jgi:hypothetical protein